MANEMVTLLSLCIAAELGLSLQDSRALVDRCARDTNIAATILLASGRSDAENRLEVQCPGFPGFMWAPTALYSRIIDHLGTDDDWNALYRLDGWKDGADFLEMEGAAYEALKRDPLVFLNRYAGGDSRALTLLEQAYQWPVSALDVELECGVNLESGIKTYDISVRTATAEIEKRAASTNPKTARERARTLVRSVRQLRSAWTTAAQASLEFCREQGENH